MMTETIERQLIGWGGVKRSESYSFDTDRYGLDIHISGKIVYCGSSLPSQFDWKTLDDIRRVLDVFGVKLKEPPKWTVRNYTAYGPNGEFATFWKNDVGADDPEAAAEYAAWMNAKEASQ